MKGESSNGFFLLDELLGVTDCTGFETELDGCIGLVDCTGGASTVGTYVLSSAVVLLELDVELVSALDVVLELPPDTTEEVSLDTVLELSLETSEVDSLDSWVVLVLSVELLLDPPLYVLELVLELLF